MNSITSTTATVETGISLPRPDISPYAEAVTCETGLLEELIGLLRRQRQAVADDDLQVLEDLSVAIHRLLHQVAEARNAREVVQRASDRSTARHASEELRAVGRTLAHEVKLNRQILRDALMMDDEYVRVLRGARRPGPRGSSEAGLGSSLINRTV